MIRILFFVPYPELKEKVVNVISRHPDSSRLSVTTELTRVDKTPMVDPKEYDIVIARGYTAIRVRKLYPELPIVELSMSGYDIVHALAECREKYKPQRVAICGFFTELYEVQEIARMFGCEAEVYQTQNYRQLIQILIKAKEIGCQAVIGGYFIQQAAEDLKIPSSIIRLGEDNINRAVNEAVHTMDLMRAERQRAESYRTIINSSKEGILHVGRDGIIHVYNHVAREFADEIPVLNHPLQESFPFLVKSCQQVLKTGMESIDEIYRIPGKEITVACSFIPVVVHGQVTGVVINLSDITRIQRLEGQIRRKLSDKGLCAKYTFQDIIHEDFSIERTIQTAKRYAMTESNIILVGETGTGKELFAQSIHNASTRSNGPFVAVNCAALPENLLESELFGYVEGAFTGTHKGGKMGLFEQAHNGTLFLDEISEISLSVQTKLLRALQEREVRRIGDDKVISVNVRIISATNRNLNDLVEKGRFRRDLLYRLDVLRIFVPPLRSRGKDVKLLFLHFLQKYQGGKEPCVNPKAFSLLYHYPFQGNVRELANIAERVGALGKEIISCDDLEQALYPPDVDSAIAERTAQDRNPRIKMSAGKEKDLIRKALQNCGGNRTQAAQLLGWDRTTLWRKMKKYPGLYPGE
ncbi:AAA family ATPase [Caproiciproducens sp. NJN-50]|uniref:sigma 54-interacting transcriptional regulator n=1 Tax=Acutalibacteraceae TaxID=3082771 RepID=UPI000FFE06C6|nr:MULTISPECIES: sigma 54-interacting transcriptional regulator [Acutalibacteraceae]QAT48913.1 AAA family ATPase [Caproiciproducens sp. NJN-50]